jgi:hypothetical protein
MASGICWSKGYGDIQKNGMRGSNLIIMEVVTRRIFSQAREGIMVVLFLGWLAATGELRHRPEFAGYHTDLPLSKCLSVPQSDTRSLLLMHA